MPRGVQYVEVEKAQEIIFSTMTSNNTTTITPNVPGNSNCTSEVSGVIDKLNDSN